MAEWFLVALTAVYVIATIFISISNSKSSRATRDQIQESRAQFIDANRAFVNINLEIIHDEVFVLQITNNGNRTAQNVHVVISNDFLGLLDQDCAEQIELLNNSTFAIGVNRSMFVNLGIRAEYDTLSQQPIGITLDYSDPFSKYHEDIVIPISQYGWGLLYDSPISDIRNYIKSASESLKKISRKKSSSD